MTSLLSEGICGSVCQQISHELFNSNIYAYIAAYLKNMGLDNISKKFEEQRSEEFEHSKMFIDFLTDMNAPVVIPEVPVCDMPIGSILDISALYLNREILTTESIDSIKHLAIDEGNPVAEEFLRKMISIQQKEYEEATTFADKCEMLKEWWQVALWDASLG